MRRFTGWRACWRAASSRSTSPAAWCARRWRISAWPIREAVHQALAAKDVFDFLGSPEGEIALAQCVLYLASAPKSNAVYAALGAAKRAAQEHGSLMPPAHILNAPTKLMKNLGYGKGYEYDHDAEEGFSGQNYFPDAMARQQFYAPKETGFEREIAKRLEYWSKLRAKTERGSECNGRSMLAGGAWAARSGSLVRYSSPAAVQPPVAGFPWGIFVVNITGGLLMGMIVEAERAEAQSVAGSARLSHRRHSGRLHHLLHLLAGQRAADASGAYGQAARLYRRLGGAFDPGAVRRPVARARDLCLSCAPSTADDDGIRLDRWFKRHYPA